MVIARRGLILIRDGVTHPVEVCLFAPVREDLGWGCRFQIHWPDRVKDMTIHGEDSVQALLMALAIVGVHLYVSNEHQDGELQPLRPDWIGYGFPIPNSLRDLLIGQDAEHF